MRRQTLYSVVKKQVGQITPWGAEHMDDKIFDNLKEHVALVDEMVSDLCDNMEYRDRPEASVQRIVKYSRDSLADLRNMIDEALA